jgi:hypothetical protein
VRRVALHRRSGIVTHSEFVTIPGLQRITSCRAAPGKCQCAFGDGTRSDGPANWDEFTQWQWMTIKDKPNPYPF